MFGERQDGDEEDDKSGGEDDEPAGDFTISLLLYSIEKCFFPVKFNKLTPNPQTQHHKTNEPQKSTQQHIEAHKKTILILKTKLMKICGQVFANG